MRILLDADTLLEFFRNRSEFIDKVKYLPEIFGANSSIQVYLSKPGLDKIVSLQALNEKESEELVTRLRKIIKILRVTKAVAKKANSSSAIDYESAIEIHLAIKANIGAIVTHKPSDFSSGELSIITLSDLPQRNHLEVNLSKNIKDLPAVLVINPEQISNLDKAFYHLPSYTSVKSLEPKESSHQLDLTCSSDKVSSPSGDNSSPRSTNARSIQQVILDALSQPVFNRATAHSNVLKYNSLATAHLAHEKHLDDLRKSILGDIQKHSDALFAAGKEHSSLVARLSSQSKNSQLINRTDLVKLRDLATESLTLGSSYNGLNTGVARISEIQSSLVDRLSIKPPLTQSIVHPDTAQFGNLAASIQVGNSLLVNRLLPEPLVARSAGKIDFLKPDIPTPVSKSSKGFADDLLTGVLHDGKAHSSLVERLSIKPILARLTAQANVTKVSSLMPENLACESSFDTFVKRIDRSSQINPLPKIDRSCSDQSGLFSQIKLLESMQRANTLESYLSRKN